MKRVHLPAAHNHAVAHYKRTTPEAFPCSTREAYALEKCRMPLHLRVLVSIVLCGWLFVLALISAAVLVDYDTATTEPVAVRSAREDAAALASREWVGLQVCKGRTFTWDDDKTLVCGQHALQEKRP